MTKKSAHRSNLLKRQFYERILSSSDSKIEERTLDCKREKASFLLTFGCFQIAFTAASGVTGGQFR
jgi:hypothetical protein